MSNGSWDDFAARVRAQRETPLTVEEISSLDGDQLDDRVWMRTAHVVDISDLAVLAKQHPLVRAYITTRMFEWEIGNGGLHQWFFNHQRPEELALVLEGYDTLGRTEVRVLLEELVAPIAADEDEWRESLRNGRLETFFDSYPETDLAQLDEQVGWHDEERFAILRANPELFAR